MRLTLNQYRRIFRPMAFARAILATLIAISIATVPATGAAMSIKSVEMSMVDQADMPCCPPPDDGKASVTCAFKCLNFVAAMFPAAIPLSHIIDGPPQFFSDGTLYGHVTPPTHPPPI
jgi:predicted metal-binding membrane protein